MPNLTITAKGQVTLRKDILQHLGARPGDKILVEKLPDGRVGLKASRPTGKLSDIFGILKKKGRRALSLEEIKEISAQGWANKQ